MQSFVVHKLEFVIFGTFACEGFAGLVGTIIMVQAKIQQEHDIICNS